MKNLKSIVICDIGNGSVAVSIKWINDKHTFHSKYRIFKICFPFSMRSYKTREKYNKFSVLWMNHKTQIDQTKHIPDKNS